MTRATLFFLLSMISYNQVVTAQVEFYRSNEIPVSADGELLAHAWAGGINSSQWSTIDLNVDGHQDLFIYERSSKQIHTFLKDPMDGSYHITFDYIGNFPSVNHWVLLRDFNCDGRKDLFTSVPGGIAVYENTTINGVLSFQLRQSLLQSFYDFGTDPFFSNIYVSTVDIPSIDDFDSDGDLDIHTFTLEGSHVEFHRNLASEMGNCDTLAFELANRCYGMMAEDAVSSTIYIGQDFHDLYPCSYNVVDPDEIVQQIEDTRDGVHSGSCICTFDYDGNDQEDLLLGDITGRNMAMVLIEDRGILPDSAIFVDETFPSEDVPMDLHVFNCGYFEDLDNDGVRDLMATPSNGTEGEDRASCYFYKNTGTDDNVNLSLQSTTFMQSDMIDVGTISFPRPLDYNQDGLMDLVVSNRGKYQDGGLYEEKFWLLENTGTATSPSYSLVTENFQGLNDLGIGDHACTTFGDLDNDSDMDMVIGDGSGQLLVFENIAAPGMPVDYSSAYTYIESDGSAIDLGASLTPQLFDLDEDGLLDLIVGERNGNINYLRNTGSSMAAEFTLVEDSIGDLVTDIDGNLIGYSSPWLYRTGNGTISALIGGESGYLTHVAVVNLDPNSTWSIDSEAAFEVYNGTRSAPALLDLDNDDLLDIINGDRSGGLGLYMGGQPSGLFESQQLVSSLTLFPNPSSNVLNVRISRGLMRGQVKLIDTTGRTLMEEAASGLTDITLNVSPLSKGLYYVVLFNGSTTTAAPFIKD